MTPQHFPPDLKSELREIVGADAAAVLLQPLRQAIAAYGSTEKDVAKNETITAKRVAHMKARLKTLQRAAMTLHMAGDGDWLAEVAAFSHARPLGDLGRRMPAERIAAILTDAEELSRWAEGAASRIARRYRKRPGASTGLRPHLAVWVARRLEMAGIKLTKSDRGQFARVLALVYDLAKIDQPENLFADVSKAIASLREMRTRNSTRK